VLAKLDRAFEASQEQAASAKQAVASAASNVAGAADSVANAVSGDGQKVPSAILDNAP
jgi:hypothetical protein